MRSLSIFTALVLAFATGCSDDAAVKHDAGVHDAPAADASGGPDASCFTDPHTNNEIINACTTAQKVYVSGRPPLQLPDGGLPAAP
jgi:hypothetical protein